LQSAQQVIEAYIKWLRERISVEQLGDYAEITTPFLDRHNDRIQVYAKRENGGYLLTDGGYTLSDLRSCGLELNTPRKQEIFDITLRGFGVSFEDDQLLVRASEKDVGRKKHNLLQAVMAIGDMFMISREQIVVLFYEEVYAYLSAKEVRYSRDVKFTGKSTYDHNFQAVIPESHSQKERIIRMINRPSKQYVQMALFAFLDVLPLRPESLGSIIFNDTEAEIDRHALDACRRYDVVTIPWSKREEWVEYLAA